MILYIAGFILGVILYQIIKHVYRTLTPYRRCFTCGKKLDPATHKKSRSHFCNKDCWNRAPMYPKYGDWEWPNE